MMGHELARAAVELLGTPFRLFGRNPATGLDCIGLVHVSLERVGRTPIPPVGYELRNSRYEHWLEHAQKSGLTNTQGEILPGDVVLTLPGPGQQHLMIVETATSAIHAHAGLRTIVRQPVGNWADVARRWRLV